MTRESPAFVVRNVLNTDCISIEIRWLEKGVLKCEPNHPFITPSWLPALYEPHRCRKHGNMDPSIGAFCFDKASFECLD